MGFTVGVTQPVTDQSTADPTSSTPSAWRTAVAEAKGMQVENFPDGCTENCDVVKTRFDHGDAVQTVITGAEYQPDQFCASGNLPVDGSGGGYGVNLRNRTAKDQSVAIEDSFSKDDDILSGPSAVIDSPLAAGVFPIYPTDPGMPVEPAPPVVQQPFVSDWEERTRRQLISERLLKVRPIADIK